MSVLHRRRFLQHAATAGIVGVADASLGRYAWSQASATGTARLYVDPARRVAKLERPILGAFVEHIGRVIYGGIYDPGSKFADAQGFRRDVLEEVRQLAIPIVRYPGGNFVSGYNWLDGVGPKQNRPRVLERAWNSIETNQFGTDEFIAWCRATGTEPLLAVNLGTGTPETAAALVEYCNVERGTRWSELRRQNGAAAPHQVQYWCLGNEMDGPWQIGHLPAAEYGRKAADAARQMRVVDPSLRLIACGSSGPFMPTYLEWDRQVLEECYNEVDAISLHRYFSNDHDTGGDSTKFVALNLLMDRQIDEVTAVCDLVRARKRSKKALWLSFDEWNVWYRDRDMDGRRQVAPHLIEEIYNLEDALLVGGILNTLLRHADRVRIACLAQLVNTIAPLMTNAQGMWKQTIYYPYAWALRYAHGESLDLRVESPTYEVSDLGTVPYLDAAGTLNPEDGSVSLFLLNRDLARDRELEIIWRDSPPGRVTAGEVLTGQDLKATNSFENPKRVAPSALEPPRAGARMKILLPARSYTVLQFAA